MVNLRKNVFLSPVLKVNPFDIGLDVEVVDLSNQTGTLSDWQPISGQTFERLGYLAEKTMENRDSEQDSTDS